MKRVKKQVQALTVGRDKMVISINNRKKAILMISLLSCSFWVQAAVQANNVAKVELKCFVELYGGKETIHFAGVNPKKLQGFAKQLLGRKVLTSIAKGKQKIYKVNECVKLTDKFTSAHARQVDQATVR